MTEDTMMREARRTSSRKRSCATGCLWGPREGRGARTRCPCGHTARRCCCPRQLYSRLRNASARMRLEHRRRDGGQRSSPFFCAQLRHAVSLAIVAPQRDTSGRGTEDGRRGGREGSGATRNAVGGLYTRSRGPHRTGTASKGSSSRRGWQERTTPWDRVGGGRGGVRVGGPLLRTRFRRHMS